MSENLIGLDEAHFENTCSASVKASSAQRVSGRMHIVSECTGSRLATASFVPAFTSQAVPDMWKQLEAMESKKGFGASESSRSAAMDPRTHGFTKKAGTGTSEPSGGGDKDGNDAHNEDEYALSNDEGRRSKRCLRTASEPPPQRRRPGIYGSTKQAGTGVWKPRGKGFIKEAGTGAVEPSGGGDPAEEELISLGGSVELISLDNDVGRRRKRCWRTASEPPPQRRRQGTYGSTKESS